MLGIFSLTREETIKDLELNQEQRETDRQALIRAYLWIVCLL